MMAEGTGEKGLFPGPKTKGDQRSHLSGFWSLWPSNPVAENETQGHGPLSLHPPKKKKKQPNAPNPEVILTHALAPSIYSPLSLERLPHHKPRPFYPILLRSESLLKGKCLQLPALHSVHHKVKHRRGLGLPTPPSGT